MRKNGFVVMGHLLKFSDPTGAHYGVYHHHGNARFPGCHLYYGAGCDGLVNLLNFDTHLSFSGILTALIVLAVARGALRYLEQMSGHYIAFKLLALLRDKCFLLYAVWLL